MFMECIYLDFKSLKNNRKTKIKTRSSDFCSSKSVIMFRLHLNVVVATHRTLNIRNLGHRLLRVLSLGCCLRPHSLSGHHLPPANLFFFRVAEGLLYRAAIRIQILNRRCWFSSNQRNRRT